MPTATATQHSDTRIGLVGYTGVQTLTDDRGERTRIVRGTLWLREENDHHDARLHVAGHLSAPGGAGVQATVRAAVSNLGIQVDVEDALFVSTPEARPHRAGADTRSVVLGHDSETALTTTVTGPYGVRLRTVWTFTAH